MANDALSKYQEAKISLRRIDRVIAMVGKRYNGGGGGVGRYVRASVRVEVYSQESDGAKNYHDVCCSDDDVSAALNAAALEMAPQIVARAREILAAAVRASAADAASLLKEALADAEVGA